MHTVHEMNLNPEPFAMIAQGEKTYELRLLDEKRRRILVGDSIRFTNTDDASRTLLVKVTSLHTFPSFKELYATLPLAQCGYRKEELATAHPDDMLAYYSAEKQRQYGVLAIGISLI